ncbi:hypothetical protein M8818_004153 [Zalaria obscura]|uniref:Uncharacterized protein n=1 Tax=Zalaria obscura TaxID=2024903 RepID=A0ACC3SCW0_9PEZI
MVWPGQEHGAPYSPTPNAHTPSQYARTPASRPTAAQSTHGTQTAPSNLDNMPLPHDPQGEEYYDDEYDDGYDPVDPPHDADPRYADGYGYPPPGGTHPGGGTHADPGPTQALPA